MYPLTPEYLAQPRRLGAFDDKEGTLYDYLVQNIKKLANDPTWKATMKDALLVESAARESLRELLTWLTPEERLAGLAPEQRLAGLAPEQRLAGLAPEQRLAGLAPAERLAGLAPDHAVLVLPDDALRALSPSYLATLPDDVQAAVRARLAR